VTDGYERIEGVEVGQYVGYRFFAVDPAWRRLPVDERAAGKEAFADVVDEFAGRMEGLRVYSTVGVRAEADLFLWTITQRYDDLLELGAALNGTPLGAWLTVPHSYLGTTKPSVYTDKKRVRQGRVAPRNAPYLIVYPFVKVRPWYFLPFEERVDIVAKMCERGHADKMVLSHDAACFMDWVPDELLPALPNWHYLHIHNDVIPALKKRGVTDEQIRTMLVDNPRHIFDRQGAYQCRSHRSEPRFHSWPNSPRTSRRSAATGAPSPAPNSSPRPTDWPAPTPSGV